MKDIVKIKIGSHIWSIRFVPKYLLNENAFATCYPSNLTIDIGKDYDKSLLELSLTHELTHALLAESGRIYEHQFNTEELCEFVAWNIEEIKRLKDKILKEYSK